jgi:hypothetical protein
MKEQRRGRKIAMSNDEVDVFLTEERICRVSTIGAGGAPHTSALWFVWDTKSLWLTSLVRSQRWTDIERDNRVSVLIDTGHDFGELRGVELRGTLVSIGEVPRTGEPNTELDVPEKLFADKYGDGRIRHDGRHAWLRLTPEKVVSWDFRKIS